MKNIDLWTRLPEGEQCVVTLGKFDGLHRGHLRLIERVLEAGRSGLSTVVFIFNIADRTLYTRKERRELLESLGVDYLIECTLDDQLKKMSPEGFVRRILVEDLHTAKVVMGEDFRFGYQRKGSPELLTELGKELGFTVEVMPEEMDGERKISSTYVREQLLEGRMEKVRDLLGRGFATSGEVLHGRGLGHRLLMPTTNLVPPAEKLMPPNGVYLSRSYFGDRVFDGITNVGYKPTVGGEDFLGVETYLFHCDEDLYGQASVVEFLRFLRPEQRFSSLEELKRQLLEDIARAETIFEQGL